MKTSAIISPRTVPIQETSLDDLFKEMSQWSSRIAARAYELFEASGFTDGHDLSDWLHAEGELLKAMPVDVKDSKDEILVTAKIPGFEVKDLHVQVNGSHLVIEGKHETTEKKKDSTKRKAEEVYRSITLPVPVLAEKARAELKNGILELKLPKAAPARQIEIHAA